MFWDILATLAVLYLTFVYLDWWGRRLDLMTFVQQPHRKLHLLWYGSSSIGFLLLALAGIWL